jgi:hypothetical protein
LSRIRQAWREAAGGSSGRMRWLHADAQQQQHQILLLQVVHVRLHDRRRKCCVLRFSMFCCASNCAIGNPAAPPPRYS